jgi:hypothetical protein
MGTRAGGRRALESLHATREAAPARLGSTGLMPVRNETLANERLHGFDQQIGAGRIHWLAAAYTCRQAARECTRESNDARCFQRTTIRERSRVARRALHILMVLTALALIAFGLFFAHTAAAVERSAKAKHDFQARAYLPSHAQDEGRLPWLHHRPR